MSYSWKLNETDQRIINQMGAKMPPRVFDFHAHTQRVADLNNELPEFWQGGPDSVDLNHWSEAFSRIFTTSELKGGLFFPGTFPLADSTTSNADLISQLGHHPQHRGLILVKPDSNREEVLHFLKHPQIVGLKPYYMFSTEEPVLQSSIKGYFPEWLWEIAHDHRSIVMTHLVRDGAVSDPGNISEIREMCTRFPGIRLILAHVARSFHYPNVKGIDALEGLENIYCDMSAICEPEPIFYLLKKWGSTRLLWGSDFPISHMRARAVTVSDGFAWLDEQFCQWKHNPFGQPTLLTLESLRALFTAIEQLEMKQEDLDNIFCGNAMRLLGIA